jgi:hypothetical protein
MPDSTDVVLATGPGPVPVHGSEGTNAATGVPTIGPVPNPGSELMLGTYAEPANGPIDASLIDADLTDTGLHTVALAGESAEKNDEMALQLYRQLMQLVDSGGNPNEVRRLVQIIINFFSIFKRAALELMLTPEKKLLSLVQILDPDDDMTPASLAKVSILDYIIDRGIHKAMQGGPEHDIDAFLEAQKSILEKFRTLALGPFLPGEDSDDDSGRGGGSGSKKAGVGKKDRRGATKHSVREQQKQVCLPKFRKTFLTFIGAIGEKKRCHFATLRKMYATNKTSHRKGGQKSCPEEKSIEDSTDDEEAHSSDEEHDDRDDDTSLPTDLKIPISENGQLYFYNLDSNGRNIDDFYPPGESATSTSGPSRLGRKHEDVNQSEIYRVLAELDGIAADLEIKRSLKTDRSDLPAELDVGHVKIATGKVYAAKGLRSVAPKSAQDKAQLGFDEWNLDDPEHDSGGGGRTHGSDFDIPKRYEKIKDIGKDNLSEYDPQKKEKYNVFAPSRFKVPCVIAPTFSNTKYAKKMNALGAPLDVLYVEGQTLRVKFGLPPDGPENEEDWPEIKVSNVYMLLTQERKQYNEFLKQVRNRVEKPNEKEKERTKTAAPKTRGGNKKKSPPPNPKKRAGKHLLNSLNQQLGAGVDDDDSQSAADSDDQRPQLRADVDDEDPSKVGHLVCPHVMVLENFICKDLDRAIAKHQCLQKWCVDTATGGQSNSMQAKFATTVTHSEDGTPIQYPLVPFGDNKAIMAEKMEERDESYRAFLQLLQNLPKVLANQVIADMHYGEKDTTKAGVLAVDLYGYLQDLVDKNPNYKKEKKIKHLPEQEKYFKQTLSSLHGCQSFVNHLSKEPPPPMHPACCLSGDDSDDDSWCAPEPNSGGNILSDHELLESVYHDGIEISFMDPPPPKKQKPTTEAEPPPDLLSLTRLNLIISSARPDGKGFGPHQDALLDRGHQLTRAPHEEIVFRTSPRTTLVPTKLHFDVFTAVHCSENMLGMSRVHWNVTDQGKRDFAAGIVTRSRTAHHQFIGANSYNYKHDVDNFVKSMKGSFGVRIANTGRGGFDPNLEPGKYLRSVYGDNLGPDQIEERAGLLILNQKIRTNLHLAQPDHVEPEVVDLCYKHWKRANGVLKRGKSERRRSYSLDCAFAPDVKWDPLQLPQAKGYTNCSPIDLLNFQVRSLPAKDPTLQSQSNGFPISISTAEGSDKKNWGNDGLVWCKELATSNNNSADMTQSMGTGVLRPKANTGFRETPAEFCRHRLVVEQALRQHQLLRIIDENGLPEQNQPLYTLHSCPLLAGRQYSPAELSGLQVSDKAHHMMAKGKTDSMTISRYYKNNRMICEIWCIVQSALTEACSQPLDNCVTVGQNGFEEAFQSRLNEIVGAFFPLYEIMHNHPLETNGSGGSSQKQGTQIQSLRNTKRNQATHVMGAPQDYQQWTNRQLLDLVKTKGPTLGLVFLPTMYDEDKKKKLRPEWMDKKLDVFNCGYVTVAKIVSEEGDISEVLYNVFSDTLDGEESVFACLDKHFNEFSHHWHRTILVYLKPAFSLVTEVEMRMNHLHKHLHYEEVSVSRLDTREIKVDDKILQGERLQQLQGGRTIDKVPIPISGSEIAKMAEEAMGKVLRLAGRFDVKLNLNWAENIHASSENITVDANNIEQLSLLCQNRSMAIRPMPPKSRESNMTTYKGILKHRAKGATVDLTEKNPYLIPSSSVDFDMGVALAAQQSGFFQWLNWKKHIAQGETTDELVRICPREFCNIVLMMYAAAAFRATDPRRTTVTHEQMRAIRRFAVQQSEPETPADSSLDELSTDSVHAAPTLGQGQAGQTCGHGHTGQSDDGTPDETDTKDKCIFTPLHMQGTETITSFAMRTKAFPTGRHMDVATNFMIRQKEILLDFVDKNGLRGGGDARKPSLKRAEFHTRDHPDWKDGEPPVQFGTLMESPDLTKPENMEVVNHLLFMDTVFRHTGNTNILERFPEWKRVQRKKYPASETNIEGDYGPIELCLPIATNKSHKEFGCFVAETYGGYDVSISSIQSKQQTGMVDPYVTKNAQKLTEFGLCCYRDYLPEGCVYAAVQKEGEKGLPEQRDRKLIMESVVHTISQASDTQYCHKNFELVHHILFDVEHMFDTIFGQHTSFNVYAGYGGREGLCVVVFGEKDLDTKVMSATTMRRRMEKLHQFQLKLYTNNLEIRRAAGSILTPRMC